MVLEEAEQRLGIEPDPAVAAYMKALGEHHNLATGNGGASGATCYARPEQRRVLRPGGELPPPVCPHTVLPSHPLPCADIAIKALGLEGCADTLVVRFCAGFNACRAHTMPGLQRELGSELGWQPACCWAPHYPLLGPTHLQPHPLLRLASPLLPQGNAMIRGVSGGQKKRVTTGEMLVGPSNVLFADEVRDRSGGRSRVD